MLPTFSAPPGIPALGIGIAPLGVTTGETKFSLTDVSFPACSSSTPPPKLTSSPEGFVTSEGISRMGLSSTGSSRAMSKPFVDEKIG